MDCISSKIEEKLNLAKASENGVELIIKANFNGCAAAKILNRLASIESQENTDLFEEFFRSHPHSKDRVKCVKNHITTNYQIACHE
jgi:predicted Zn-dependent protease